MGEQKPVWTILKILEWTKQYFADKGVENPRLDAEVLLCDVLQCQRIRLYVNFDQPLEERELARYRDYVLRRGRHEPLAYILGHKAFMKYTFKVTPDTLVPRPETELLVEKVIRLNTDKGAVKILDLGCGSGAIIVSLLKELPEACGWGVDISAGAAKVTEENARLLGTEERLCCAVGDLYAACPQERFDVIVSNPPYIPAGDIASLAADVRREPRQALDGGKDGLDFYRRIVVGLGEHLCSDGMCAFEVGIHQAEAVAELCYQQGLTVSAVCRDYAHIERMVFAAREGSRYANEIMALRK